MAIHDDLVVKDAPDHAFFVDDICDARGPKAEAAFHVVEPPYFPCLVTAEPKWGTRCLPEPAKPLYAVRADADNNRAFANDVVMHIAESIHFPCTSQSKGARVEEQDDVAAPVF